MTKLPVFSTVVCLAVLASSAFGQEAPQPPPAPNPPPAPDVPAPGTQMKPFVRKAFAIRSRPMPGKIVVAGKTVVYVQVPQDVKETSVTVKVADHTFTSKTRPYRIDIDFSAIPDGKITVQASAKDDSGGEVWKGNATVTVDNAGKVARPAPSLPGGPPGSRAPVKPNPPGTSAPPTPGAPGVVPAKPPVPSQDRPKPNKKHNGTTGELAPLPPAIVPPPGPGNPANAEPGTEPAKPLVSVSQVFKSKKYGVQLLYPAGWKVEDQSAEVKPKEPGSFWFVFSSPENPPKMIINFRHRQLKKPSTPENYAKYNPYLLKWDRVEVNGKPAFETTQGAEEASRVVHRKMVIDGRHIWMFNCIDQSGQPEFESKALLNQVVNSAVK